MRHCFRHYSETPQTMLHEQNLHQVDQSQLLQVQIYTRSGQPQWTKDLTYLLSFPENALNIPGQQN